jgi:hypothetical protein
MLFQAYCITQYIQHIRPTHEHERVKKQRICLIVDPTFLALRIKARVRAVAVYIIQPQQLMGFRSRQEPKHPNLTNLLIRRYGGR